MITTLTLALALVGQEPSTKGAAQKPADDKERAAEALALAQKAVGTYSFSLGDQRERPEPQPEPILSFTNPILGAVYGDLYLWTYRGRPEVVASFVKWYHPFNHRTHEFQSLSLGPIIGERSGEPVWFSNRPGVELAPIPDAAEPAATPALRLRQMRDLARQFTGRQADRTGVDRDLRLLAKPLYRYEKTVGDLVDGALFVFALGTDPDAFLLIEDRIVEGKPRWLYGLTRMTALPMKISHQDHPVWNVPLLGQGQIYSHRETYTCFWNVE
jgi:hypothetical protein